MMQSLYIHTIKVIRFNSSSYNELGEPNFSSSSFVAQGNSEIPCRIETYNEKTQHRESGVRMANTTLIYVDPAYQLRLGDLVLAGSLHTPELNTNDRLGIIEDVTPALKGLSVKIDHYEIRLTNP